MVLSKLYISILVVLIVVFSISGTSESAYSDSIIELLSEIHNPHEVSESVSNLMYRKSILFVFVPFSQAKHVSMISSFVNKHGGESLEIILINTEDFISESECVKVLDQHSIKSEFIYGTKLSSWDKIKSYLELNNINAILIDRTGKIHRYQLNTDQDCKKIYSGNLS